MLEALARVLEVLAVNDLQPRVIGASALATYGVSRSTRDIDLLIADSAVLDPSLWDWTPVGFEVEVRRGDATDPLLGVVRIDEELGPEPDWEKALLGIDIVVPRGAWVREMAVRAGPDVTFGPAVRVPAVELADLIVLKLYAGSSKDAWDIHALLEANASDQSLRDVVSTRVRRLPADARALWVRIEASFSP